jgi:uncharacterized Ntn-hydrolase superfamily protein
MTYSIIARDQQTGELGVAVQSHWFSVGPIVPWARPGVGAVATQANAEVSYGPKALELLADGIDAAAALEKLLAADPGAPGRQVAVIDVAGRTATHTGAACIPFAGHVTGSAVSCQANMMASERVWPAMLAAFEASGGRLAERLMDALEAGEDEGGDVRGRQSAALLVVPPTGESWQAAVSLRVEDDPEPLAELRRLLSLQHAYAVAGEADERANRGSHEEAGELYRRACELAPENAELRFWAGLAAAHRGDLDAGVRQVRSAIEDHHGWLELLRRLSPEIAPAASAVLHAITEP